MQNNDSNEHDKLSNLASALVAIERAEGGNYDSVKFDALRLPVLNAAGRFRYWRFDLGRTLAPYHDLFVQGQVWGRAETKIANYVGVSTRELARIIKDSKLAADLTPVEIEALMQENIDPGKVKYLPIVKALSENPRPTTRAEANTAVALAVGKHRASRKVASKPAPGSLEEFAKRLEKLSSGYFEKQSPAAKTAGLKYCFEIIISGLHTDVPELRKYSSMRDVPTPKN